jgi:hypothetical protein
LETSALSIERLLVELAEHELLGEVLGADGHRGLAGAGLVARRGAGATTARRASAVVAAAADDDQHRDDGEQCK